MSRLFRLKHCGRVGFQTGKLKILLGLNQAEVIQTWKEVDSSAIENEKNCSVDLPSQS